MEEYLKERENLEISFEKPNFIEIKEKPSFIKSKYFFSLKIINFKDIRLATNFRQLLLDLEKIECDNYIRYRDAGQLHTYEFKSNNSLQNSINIIKDLLNVKYPEINYKIT